MGQAAAAPQLLLVEAFTAEADVIVTKRGSMPADGLTAKKKRSSKGALVKGVSAQLPISLLDEPAFREGLRELTRGYSGIYLLYKRQRLYYVGLATDLYGRLRGHSKNRHRGKWDRFSIFRVGRVRYLKDIESILLRVTNPPGNAVSGHFRRDSDLTRVLQRIQRERARSLEKIRKALRHR